MNREQQRYAFAQQFYAVQDIQFVASDMSPRSYYRIVHDGGTHILMDADSGQDLMHFAELSLFLNRIDVRAPKTYHLDLDHHLMILEDFGDITVSKYLASPHCHHENEKALFEQAIDIIHKIFYKVGERGMPSLIKPYEESIYINEVGIFHDYYYQYIHHEHPPAELAMQWETLWAQQLRHILPMSPNTMVLRDYHVDNLMILDHTQLGVLDFQDALYGSVMYDYISLVEDARRDMAPEHKAHLQEYFLRIFDSSDHKDLLHVADVLGALRHAKVLGVFTRYALVQGNKNKLCHLVRTKKYFVDALERAELKEILHFVRDLNLI